MIKRTFGWIQNPNKLETLKKVVLIFTDSSFKNEIITKNLPILLKNGWIEPSIYNKIIYELKNNYEYSYEILKGKGAGNKSRKNALCSGIIQLCINGQKNVSYKNLDENNIICKKLFTDDWTADGYLRWAIATGLIKYNKKKDTCCITALGKKLAETEVNSFEEKECFTIALLSYPPVIRILTLLSDGKKQTKFELGAKFGFKEELGFTSIPQNFFTFEYFNSPISKRADIKSNLEGDSDKYVRTICNWLKQMNWLATDKKTVHDVNFNKDIDIMAYKITPAGERALKISKGYSSKPKIPKIVYYEMLASNKASNSEYLRKRRGLIIQTLSSQKTLDTVSLFLKKNGIDETVLTIEDEIKSLANIGLTFEIKNNKYKLLDEILELEIPKNIVKSCEVNLIQNRVREKLTHLSHDYLSLIDIAYWNNSLDKNENARNFELETAKLFNELGFRSLRLGDTNKPDVIISNMNNGTIIDNKAYKEGFSLSKHDSDEMNRYILENNNRIDKVPLNEWWKNFPVEVNNFTFLFITSFLKGNFEDNLRQLSSNSNTLGAAIGVENFLYLANDIKSGKISKKQFFNMFDNKELISYA